MAHCTLEWTGTARGCRMIWSVLCRHIKWIFWKPLKYFTTSIYLHISIATICVCLVEKWMAENTRMWGADCGCENEKRKTLTAHNQMVSTYMTNQIYLNVYRNISLILNFNSTPLPPTNYIPVIPSDQLNENASTRTTLNVFISNVYTLAYRMSWIISISC